MANHTSPLLTSVSTYYDSKIAEFGPCSKGVDWNNEAGQELRFKVLSQVLPQSDFSILDYGCGYAALYAYLKRTKGSFEYIGYDIAPQMLEAAKKHHQSADIQLVSDLTDTGKCWDYVVASGIFNVMVNNPEKQWEDYVFSTIAEMGNLANKGIAFNMLTGYSDEDKKVSHLYYADPHNIFDFCKRNISKYVSLIHDYPLWEFSILIRKPETV